MFPAIVIIPLSIVFLWLFSIRPYCRRNGKGYTPGANIGATIWIDWQEAREIAKTKGNKKMALICHLFLWIHFLVFAIFIFILFPK